MAEECKKLPANTPSKKRGHRIRSWSSCVLPGLLPTRVLNCVLRYRKGTRTLSLIFGGTRPPSLVSYSNADCRSRAVSGYGYSLDQLVLSKQRLVADSTCYAEYIAFYNPLALWLHNSITPDSQMSSSECSLSEERMQGKQPSCRGFAIQRRVQRSTGLINGEGAIGYILIPDETFDLIV